MLRLLSYFLLRAGCWSRVRKEHLRKQPCCAACGRARELEVHHIIPVSVDKTRECDPTNLVTLCADPCHLVFGHLLNFRRYNAHVLEDCKKYLARIDGQD